MPSIISLSNVSKKFGKITVLDDVTISIEKNELLGIVGSSGSGKTTFLKIITGFYKPSGGKIYFNGKDVTKKTGELKKAIGFATQENAFYHELSVLENMLYYCRMFGIAGDIRSYVCGILRSVELAGYENAIAKNLSGGMKRRLDLAISIIHDPEIVVMDEPTSGLDPVLRREIWRIIKTINSFGKTVVIASHMFDEISANCSRACVIINGRIEKVFDISAMRQKMDARLISSRLEETIATGGED